MNGGAALDTVGMTPEPISIRAITAGYTLMFGATGCVLSALMAGAFGYVTVLSRALPAWTGWVGIGVAAFNVLAIPTMFNGTSTANFVSAGGDRGHDARHLPGVRLVGRRRHRHDPRPQGGPGPRSGVR